MRIRTDKHIRIPDIILRNAESGYSSTTTIIDGEKVPAMEFEMIYWRKWWGIRNEVINTLDTKYDYHHIEQYHYPLDSEDVESIIDILENYDNDIVWNDYGDSIWYYDEDYIHDQITVDIEVLKTLAKFMRTAQYKDMLRDNVIEVYFYDSY